MNLSEFKQALGAEPRSEDPQMQHARELSAEHAKAADDAEAFEQQLDRALALSAPENLLDNLLSIPSEPAQPIPLTRAKPARTYRLPLAAAASLALVAVAASLIWQSRHSWDSVEDYLADHYRHDGQQLEQQVAGTAPDDVQALLAKVGAQANRELTDIIGLIKHCPTPDGKGVHMVLNTETGPVTLIYMPETPVTDGERLTFDTEEAVLVSLPVGSAAIIGHGSKPLAPLLALVRDAISPLPGTS